MTDTRYCRVCWNTQGWQHPTGEASQLEKTSYVSAHGFGHEEWLFNPGWLMSGYKYGYLQPLSYFRQQEDDLNIILYTVEPAGKRLFVGRISDCQIVDKDEALKVFKFYSLNRWVDEMAADLIKIGVDPSPIYAAHIRSNPIVNVRFKFENVEKLDRFVAADVTHKVRKLNRYRPIVDEEGNGWAEILRKKATIAREINFQNGKLKSTAVRFRKAQEGMAYDPAHDRIQNALFKSLVIKYGQENVGYENNRVDIAVKSEFGMQFYEIKTASTAKEAIRLALGQLLEYAHWPNLSLANKLIIVGLALPTDETKLYMNYLRDKYKLPIFYCSFESTTGILGVEC